MRTTQESTRVPAIPGLDPTKEIHRCTELLARYALGGDRLIFDEMARTAGPFLERRAALEVGRLSPDLDPGEVVQETLLNLYRYGKGFRPEVPYAFSTWVGRILRNVVLRMMKNKRRIPTISLQDLAGLEVVDSENRGPMLQAVEVEQREELGRDFRTLLHLYFGSYQGLTDLQRNVLDRVAMQGKNYREVAECLGMRVEAVKMVAFRARRRMSSDLQKLSLAS